MLNEKRREVCGVPVDCLTMADAVSMTEDWIEKGNHPLTIFAVNPEKVIRAQHDPELLATLRGAGLLIPDGIGVVLAARLLGLGHAERVPGSELMPKLCERAVSKGYTVFLFGASVAVNQQAVEVLRERYPGIRIVGSQHGYVKDEDMPGVIACINVCKPDLLFVALGSPRQEIWMTRYLPQLTVKVCQGVGGTFDVIAGRVRRAPRLFRSLNFEWFYRLASDPRRIRRQTALPMFAYRVLKSRFMKQPSHLTE